MNRNIIRHFTYKQSKTVKKIYLNLFLDDCVIICWGYDKKVSIMINVTSYKCTAHTLLYKVDQILIKYHIITSVSFFFNDKILLYSSFIHHDSS